MGDAQIGTATRQCQSGDVGKDFRRVRKEKCVNPEPLIHCWTSPAILSRLFEAEYWILLGI